MFTEQHRARLARLDCFTRAYIETALWSSNDNADDSGGKPLDANYSIEDIAPETLATIEVECLAFQTKFVEQIAGGYRGQAPWSDDEMARAGHDFWLTRNGHGCGFWNGGWNEDVATILSEGAKAFGGVNLYVGDDGLIYQG